MFRGAQPGRWHVRCRILGNIGDQKDRNYYYRFLVHKYRVKFLSVHKKNIEKHKKI